MTDRSFPLPSQIAAVPGAEGWEAMYPYFSRFQPEDDQRFWFYNSMHFPEVVPAFDGITSEIPYTAIGANTARLFSFPTTMSIEYRILNGRVYITANPVTDPARIEGRLADFQERAGYYYANWDRLYGEWQQRIEALIAEIEAVEVPELGDLDPIEVITSGRGFASNHFLRENFHRCIDLYSKMWHHHTEFLMLGYGAYVVFFEFCKQAFPEMGDQMVARMVAGMDVTMYRPDDELKKLAALAVELDLGDLFVEGAEPAKVLSSLGERGEAGARWLAALEAAKDPWFNVSVGDGFYHHHLSWADDLTVPFAALPRYVEQIAAGEDLTRPTERLAQERDRIADEYRALLGSDDEKGAFDQMLGLCRLVFPYIESHKFYCEHWFTTRFFQKIRAFGTLLAERGVLLEADDVFHLRHVEVEDALADVMLAWASGGTELGARHWQPIVAQRKRILETLSGWSPPPALGAVPEALNDPAVKMLWGITQETIETWLGGEDDDGSTVRGYAASPGVVEGIARVLLNVNDIGQIREGEVLVCPVTAPSWGPVFGKIAAAVSDIGGTMSHAAIVAREYGMPAVVGTGVATTRIKTGDRVRVDGGPGGNPHDHALRPALPRRRDRRRADRRRQGRQPRRAVARRYPGASRVRGDDGGLPADRRAPHRPRRADPRARGRARSHGRRRARRRHRGGAGGAGVRAPTGGGRPGRHRGVRGVVRGVRRPHPAGRRPVECDQRGQRGGQLRRAPGHLPVGARRRIGARARAPLLGEPLQHRVGDLPAAPWRPRDRPRDGRRRPADGGRPQLRRDVHPQPPERRQVRRRHRRQLGPGLGSRQRRRHPRLLRRQQGHG